MRRFPAEALPEPGQELHLDPQTSHHVLRVTLLPRGSHLELFDGNGLSCQVKLIGAEGSLAKVRGLTQPSATAPTPEIHVVLGLPRKPAVERVLRMATELGMGHFWPFVAQRSIAKGSHPERWGKLTEQAARQSGRSELPQVHSLASLEEQLQRLPPHLSRVVLTPGAAKGTDPTAPIALLIGPEGGLTPAELELAERHAFQARPLGTTVLRSDTAVIAAIARFAL
ncbi:MAG: 16S rRNA (uracil1498-N3)-methyltransferase [Cognaticolwellia sp.]